MFTKKGYSPSVVVGVRHDWHEGEFRFHFAKVLPAAALEAEKVYFGLTEPEQADAARKALVNVVALMSTREPEGFVDLPGSTTKLDELTGRLERINAELRELDETTTRAVAGTPAEGARPSPGDDARAALERERDEIGRQFADASRELDAARATPLADRIRGYFDEPAMPELEQIAAAAWTAYKRGARPEAYLKSLSSNGS